MIKQENLISTVISIIFWIVLGITLVLVLSYKFQQSGKYLIQKEAVERGYGYWEESEGSRVFYWKE